MRNKSNENWEAGELLIQNKKYNAAATRIYYSLVQSLMYFMHQFGFKLDDFKRNSENTKGETHSALKQFLFSDKLKKDPFNSKTSTHKVFTKWQGLREKAYYETGSIQFSELRNMIDDAAKFREYFVKD